MINNTIGRGMQSKSSNSLSADAFNYFFLGVSDKLRSSAQRTCDALPLSSWNVPNNHYFDFHSVSQIEMRAAIRGIKPGKCMDCFGLNADMLKSVRELIVGPLTKIFNECVNVGYFPDALKLACVTPIFKKGDVNDPSNYRPISILPVVSKVFERLLKDQLVAFIEGKNILSLNQFGFRTGKSTGAAISEFIEKITRCFEEGEFCSVSLLDLSKAFDCVTHEVLIRKLYMYNILPEACKLLSSYLSERNQCVHYKGQSSRIGKLTSGVPQGSILGPVLFLLYINDFPDSLSPAETILYADDTTIFSYASTSASAELINQARMERASFWFRNNELVLNEDKSVNIVFSLRPNDGAHESARFLGVYIDNRLTWAAHGDHLSRKLSSACFALRGLANSVSSVVLRVAYFSLFQSHLAYGVLSWGHSAISKRVFAIQRRAVRVMDGLGYRDDCRHSFVRQNILTLPSLYILACLKYILSLGDLSSTFGAVHTYNTRHCIDLRPPRLRLSRSRCGTNYYCFKIYNAIDPLMRDWPHFKIIEYIKNYLIRSALYSVDEFFLNPPRVIS